MENGMRKIRFSLFAVVLFLIAGAVSGASLELIPSSASYVVTFDLNRIHSLPAVKEELADTMKPLKAAGVSRVVITGADQWAVVLADFSCSQEAILNLLAGNGAQLKKSTVSGRTFYRIDHNKLGNVPAVRKPLLTFVAPNVLALIEQKRVPTALEAMKKCQKVRAGKEILWSCAVPKRLSVSGAPQLKDAIKMFRGCRFLTFKMDMDGAGQQDLITELGAICKNENDANLAAFMLPAGMMLAVNYLCASDPDLCNKLAGMVQPGVSGKTAYARLKLSPDDIRRINDAIQKTTQRQLENSVVQRK